MPSKNFAIAITLNITSLSSSKTDGTSNNREYQEYCLNLLEILGRKRKLDITRGNPSIWSAAIVYVIARANFLYDPENPDFLTADDICGFFETNKHTTSNKATLKNICMTMAIHTQPETFLTLPFFNSESHESPRMGIWNHECTPMHTHRGF